MPLNHVRPAKELGLFQTLALLWAQGHRPSGELQVTLAVDAVQFFDPRPYLEPLANPNVDAVSCSWGAEPPVGGVEGVQWGIFMLHPGLVEIARQEDKRLSKGGILLLTKFVVSKLYTVPFPEGGVPSLCYAIAHRVVLGEALGSSHQLP